MRQVIRIVVIVFIVLFYCNVTIAAEKPLIIKGLYIGMDINEARNILTKLLGKEWKLSAVGNSEKVLEDYKFGSSDIFGNRDIFWSFRKPPVGDRGFAIIEICSRIFGNYDNYEGYISCDKNNDKVTRISFGEKLTDTLFATSEMNADDFVSLFRTNYDMPEFNWITHGWLYTSPNGYTIKIKTNKLIDINKTPLEQMEKPKIKFD